MVERVSERESTQVCRSEQGTRERERMGERDECEGYMVDLPSLFIMRLLDSRTTNDTLSSPKTSSCIYVSCKVIGAWGSSWNSEKKMQSRQQQQQQWQAIDSWSVRHVLVFCSPFGPNQIVILMLLLLLLCVRARWNNVTVSDTNC